MKKLLFLLLSVYSIVGLAQQKPDATLIINANTVINATSGQNTAARIGGDFLDLVNSKQSVIPLSASGTNTYIAASSVVTGYSNGLFEIQFQNGNTGASTLSINSLGTINLQKLVSGSYTALSSGDIQNNQVLKVWYDQPNNTFQVFIGGGTSIAYGTGVQTALGINIGNAGAPVLFNGAGGTPSSIGLANGTGLPISTGVSGLGSNIPAWLTTPSSANLAAAVTDETGSGPLVFGTGPAITLGNGTGLPLTTGVTGTLPVTSGGTGLTFLGTEGQMLSSNGSNAVWGSNKASSLPQVGTIISENWTNLTNWTKTGAQTFTVAGNTLSVIGGSPGSIQLGNYYTNSGYGNTQYMSWTISTTITVGTISASSYGVGIGTKGGLAGTTQSDDFFFAIMMDAANKGIISLYNVASSALIKSTGFALSLTAGDILAVTVSRDYDQISCTVVNTSLTPKNSVTLTHNRTDNYNLGNPIPNINKFAIYALGGTHTMTALTVNVKQKIGADILIVGDSRTVGYYVPNAINNWPSILTQYVNGIVDYYAGDGNYIQDQVVSEILTLAPKNIIILMGTTNANGGGESAATVATRIQTLISSLTGYTQGTNLFYIDELPRTIDMTTYSNQIKTTNGTTGCIYAFQSFLSSAGSGATNPAYFTNDNTHLSVAGNYLLSEIVANQLPTSIKKSNVGKNVSYATLQGNKLFLGNYTQYSPSLLSVIDPTGMSQIRVGNSTANGGAIFSNTTNEMVICAGCYNDGTNYIALTAAGSTNRLNAGNWIVQTFSGATIGSTTSPLTKFAIFNAGQIATGGTVSVTYRTTNGGGDVLAHLFVDPVGSLTAGIGMAFDTGFLGFTQGNGTRRILGATITPSGLTTTAGSEVMGLDFKTQSGGTAASTKMVLTGTGRLFVGGSTTPTAVLHLLAGTATASTAPLKFTAPAALLTSPEALVIEPAINGDYLNLTTTTGTIRRVIVAGSAGRATAQTAANASVATYTLGATDATYEVSANILVTTSSAENFTVTVSYTDEGNTARVLTLNFQTIGATIGTAINFSNGAVPYEGIITHVRAKASTAITVKTTGTFTGCTYNVEGVIKQTN